MNSETAPCWATLFWMCRRRRCSPVRCLARVEIPTPLGPEVRAENNRGEAGEIATLAMPDA